MVRTSPLGKRQQEYGRNRRPPQPDAHRPGAARGVRTEVPPIEYVRFGPPDGEACDLVGTFGDLEAEYAAIRKGAGLFDSPHRAVLVVTGDDRRDFLNRMVTQELKDLAAGGVRPAFWLNRKGRVDADLLLIELGDRLIAAMDDHCAAATVESLGEYVFTEDVAIADATGDHHTVAVHGPAAQAVVSAAAGAAYEAAPGTAAVVEIAGAPVVAARRDQAGVPGLELIMPRDRAVAVWDALLATDATVGAGRHRVRPVGWHAFNIARIEAGTPLLHVDFGHTNVPHETGVLDDRVSFTKGCYLGQEIVARIQSLGRPKQVLAGLRIADGLLPVAGAEVFAVEDGAQAARIGVVTSSTLSPMLGAQPIAFATLRSEHAAPGTAVAVSAEGRQAAAEVRPLRFVDPAGGGEAR